MRDGSVSEAAGLAAVRTRPAPAWITSTPHGAEPAAGEAIARNLYELAARTDCWNAMRLRDMDFFLLPVRNPDGRDAIQRTSAWTFDHNRDFGTQNQIENGAFLPLFKQYPGVFFIDAHQTGNGYFFPPNEDPVHHEISDFAVDYIGDLIGPAIRQAFNDQSIDYFNYQTYDLFVPEYGDTVPSLLVGRRRHDVREGHERGLRQAGLRALPGDRRHDRRHGPQQAGDPARAGSEQWAEAVRQGAGCDLEPNELVSPLTSRSSSSPPTRCAATSSGPTATRATRPRWSDLMQDQGVHVYRFEHDVNANGVREFGTGTSSTRGAAEGHAVHADEPAAEALDPGRHGRGPVRADRVLLRRGDVVVPDAPRPRGRRASSRASCRPAW